MTDLLELIVPLHTADPDSPVVQAVVETITPHMQGGAVVEVTGPGEDEAGPEGGVIVRGYLPASASNQALLQRLQQRLLTLPDADRLGEPRVHRLSDQDWAEVWKQHYRPLRVGKHLVISPSWEQPDVSDEDKIVWLDPGMAFGTGMHPSTRVILRLLERHLRPHDQVLDVGTGSGILSIAALKLGADYVHATDIDPIAITTARQNLVYNHVTANCHLEVGSVPAGGQFHIVCANILADVLATLLLHEDLGARVAPDGLLLLSGIIEYRRHVMDLALAARGWAIFDQECEGEWLAFAARKSRGSADTRAR